MNTLLTSLKIRPIIGGTASLFIALCFAYFAQSWWAASSWLLGHALIFLVLPYYQQHKTFGFNKKTQAFAAALMPSVFAFFLSTQITEAAGWRGFVHLSDLSLKGFAHLLSLWPLAMGLWLLGTSLVQSLRTQLADRQERVLYFILAALASSFMAFMPFIHADFLSLLLIISVVLLSQDIYLDSARSSMTWLLLWLFFIAIFISIFAFRQSIKIDQKMHQRIASDIARLGQPDSIQAYHLAFQWDTLSSHTAQQRLSKDLQDITAGTGQFIVKNGRTDWVYKQKNNSNYIQVGRPLGGIRPLLALTSFLFLIGLIYYLSIRAISWLLAYPIYNLLLPIYGPSSLRVRIQLYFFGLALVAFLLVGWFTLSFFKGESAIFNSWLEQLLSLYAFLLLIAGALGILLANSITEPIVEIGKRLSQTSLQDNEPLHWPKDDEIGRLVKNYNQMILALDESVERLALHERESAWREMAKQVAHEIKNPLTPMKLQLQQLLRLEQIDPEKARLWSQKTTGSLIEQIDGLALIANAFSEFARLPEAQNSKFDLKQLAQSAYELHISNPQNAAISIELPEQACTVLADKNQLLRVLNNLIRNALQALDPNRVAQVEIKLLVQTNNYRLEVHDNGKGVPESIQHKLFQPNFTTKSSGMGLGLAMCRNIITQANGIIDFTTTPNEGSCFYFELPQERG